MPARLPDPSVSYRKTRDSLQGLHELLQKTKDSSSPAIAGTSSPALPRMPPSDKKITHALRKAVEQLHREGGADLTVNNARRIAAEELKLDEDFLKTDDVWKQKSRSLVKDYGEELMDEEPPVTTKAKATRVEKGPTKTNGKKPGGGKSAAERQRPKKLERQLKEFGEEKTDGDSENEDDPNSKKRKALDDAKEEKPKAKKVKHNKTDSESELSDIPTPAELESKKATDSESELSEVKDFASKSPSKSRSINDVEESEMSEVLDEEPKPKKKGRKSDKASTKKDAEESEMSDVLDEEPKPKKKGRTSKEVTASVSTKGAKRSSKPATAGLSAEEAELKTVQSQLVKCGIKKIWGIYLKQFGDDTKAKIKHLKEMLREAGMTGRFSNEKAAEIKEARELAADLEAVKQGEEIWGIASGKRASRSGTQKQSKKYKVSASEEDDEEGDGEEEERDGDKKKGKDESQDEDDDDDEDAGVSFRNRRKGDLAFLSSEDEDSE